MKIMSEENQIKYGDLSGRILGAAMSAAVGIFALYSIFGIVTHH